MKTNQVQTSNSNKLSFSVSKKILIILGMLCNGVFADGAIEVIHATTFTTNVMCLNKVAYLVTTTNNDNGVNVIQQLDKNGKPVPCNF